MLSISTLRYSDAEPIELLLLSAYLRTVGVAVVYPELRSVTNFIRINKIHSLLPILFFSIALTACGGGDSAGSDGGKSSSGTKGYSWSASPKNLQIEMTVKSASNDGANVGKMVLFMKASSSDPSGYGPAGFNTRDVTPETGTCLVAQTSPVITGDMWVNQNIKSH